MGVSARINDNLLRHSIAVFDKVDQFLDEGIAESQVLSCAFTPALEDSVSLSLIEMSYRPELLPGQ